MRNETIPRQCQRCGADFSSSASIMSKFNRDTICVACKADETEAPGYKAANDAEFRSVRGGDYNFSGVGLSNTDREFLTKRILERSRRAEAETQERP